MAEVTQSTTCTVCGGARGQCDWFALPEVARPLFDQGQCENCARGHGAGRDAMDSEFMAAMRAKAERWKREREARWFALRPIIGSALLKLDEGHPNFDRAGFEKVRAWSQLGHDEDDDGPLQGLVLQGPPGVGKTRMAAWLCQDRTLSDHEFCEWVAEPEFFAAVGNLGRPGKRDDAEELLSRWIETDTLFFDDLGSCPLTEPRARWLFDLVNRRYRTSSPTIWTTNRSPTELARRIERFWGGQGSSANEAADEADKLLRRIYGTNEAPLVTVVLCGAPQLREVTAA